ncbi:hypothetical protein JQ596_34610 [Bradyrhizobium manausense]|uniref:hypothetical protein n=1 Tax=Bradyrhizobium TaxID=374 RepID=UPI001BAD34BB|nr:MULTISPECIES: hypothetical protein [Bradyrhizobium]MBR0830651.1 hypothetical protein [Bradyrhizobium manausense]UVO31035.1 hypothetical protein KUF59_10495 [Bradyrhizobium arachidis]
MRQSIDTAPRNGKDIWVEDATGAVEAAHWSPEAGRWVWKDGSPINTAPTYWYPVTAGVDPADEQSDSPLAATMILIPVVLVGAALLFGPFNVQTIPEITRLDGRSALGLDQRPGIAAGSQALLQRETTGVLMPSPSASMVRTRQPLDEDAPRGAALAGEQGWARSELGVLTNKLDDKADQVRLAATAELPQSFPQEREKFSLTGKLANVSAGSDTTLALPSRSQDDAVLRLHVAETATEELRQSLQEEQARSAALVNELAGTRREIDIRKEQSRSADDAAAQQKDAADREIAELQQSVQQERERSAALVRQANAARAATASAEQQRHEAQSRAAALASELAGIARGPLTTDDAAAEQSQAAEREIAELRQSLQHEQQKSAALVTEVKAAQAAAANAEQQRRALEEAQAHAAALASELAETRGQIETRSVQLREANDAASQQRQASDREIAELRQSLQQERTRTEAVERGLALAWRPTDERAPAEQTNEGPILPATRNVEAATAEPPMVANQNEAEARLILRARALLDQGNIGAARIVLELAAEKDIAQASFMLAETYDPAVLSRWGTYGTRGEAAKARELYAKAHRGGIPGAKERLDALPR